MVRLRQQLTRNIWSQWALIKFNLLNSQQMVNDVSYKFRMSVEYSRGYGTSPGFRMHFLSFSSIASTSFSTGVSIITGEKGQELRKIMCFVRPARPDATGGKKNM